MIPLIERPEVISSGQPIHRIDMRQMDPEDIQVMLEQSRDGFYSNKILAPIREYSTNAKDSHTRKGIGNRPIQVHLPTELEPELRIRDFGTGLSFDVIADIYFKYWKSTKRNTNDENGCLGIGSKSAFTYTDIYTVTTWCEGMKTIITGNKNGFADVVYRDENKEGAEDGVEITIPVLKKDIERFRSEALNFYKFWKIRPIIFGVQPSVLEAACKSMDDAPFLFGDGWSIRPAPAGGGESVALMGHVAYPIDWNQIRSGMSSEALGEAHNIFGFLEENLTVLEFDNGTLSFTPNRESLQYTDLTNKIIGEKLVTIYQKLLTMITDKISVCPNLWEAKITYNRIFRRELDGFDKSMLYGGNLSTIETILKGNIKWNGIVVDGGTFSDLECWDKYYGYQSFFRKGMSPVLTTFVKNEENTATKLCKCQRRYNNKILASPKSVILIQDTDKPSLLKHAADWYLYASGQEIGQVYGLEFNEQRIKDDFYKRYNFDTVPVVKISEIIDTVRAHARSKRASRGGVSTGGSSVERVPLYCPYVEIKPTPDWSSINWKHEDVNAKGVDGGIYVPYHRKSSNIPLKDGDYIESYHGGEYINSLHSLCVAAGEDVTKIHGIYSRTYNSAWFAKAVKAGVWILLDDYVSEMLSTLDMELVQTLMALHDTDVKVCVKFCKAIQPLLKDQNGDFYRFCNLVDSVSPYHGIQRILTKLCSDGCENKDITKQVSDTVNDLIKKYPLVFAHQDFDDMKYDTKFGEKHYTEQIKAMSDYINLMDCGSI